MLEASRGRNSLYRRIFMGIARTAFRIEAGGPNRRVGPRWKVHAAEVLDAKAL
jgi:hypothetical protein